MNDEDRLQRFEEMLASIEEEYALTEAQVEELKAQSKMKSATFKQLLARKLTLASFLDTFARYGLS